MSAPDRFVAISPEILYFGTPVAVISSLNSDGTTNLAAMSSFWALGDRLVLGLTRFGQTWANLERRPECVLNMPSPREWQHVERRVLTLSATRVDIESWSPLFYVFRHYYGKGAYLGKSFRARDG